MQIRIHNRMVMVIVTMVEPEVEDEVDDLAGEEEVVAGLVTFELKETHTDKDKDEIYHT